MDIYVDFWIFYDRPLGSEKSTMNDGCRKYLIVVEVLLRLALVTHGYIKGAQQMFK